MREPEQPQFASFMLVVGILIGGAVGPTALGDPEPAATPATSTPDAADAPLTGPEVYNEICISCHAAPGVGGAPALGDSDAWSARIAQGMDTLVDHALHGFSGSTGVMPRKGGRLDLSDQEITAAVEYLVEQASQ